MPDVEAVARALASEGVTVREPMGSSEIEPPSDNIALTGYPPEARATAGRAAGTSDAQAVGHASVTRVTIVQVKRIVIPAAFILARLSPPNDLSPSDRELFDEVRASVTDLEARLARVEDENKRLSEENAELRAAIEKSLPLWKKAAEKFVFGAAGAVGAGTVTLFLGYIAHTLHLTFEP